MGALLLGWNEVCGLLVPKLHLVSQHVDVEQLPHVLFPVILCGQQAADRHVLGGYRHATGSIKGMAMGGWLPVMVLFEANFFRILPSSLSTLAFSCSLFWQFLMSAMKTCDRRG